MFSQVCDKLKYIGLCICHPSYRGSFPCFACHVAHLYTFQQTHIIECHLHPAVPAFVAIIVLYTYITQPPPSPQPSPQHTTTPTIATTNTAFTTTTSTITTTTVVRLTKLQLCFAEDVHAPQTSQQRY